MYLVLGLGATGLSCVRYCVEKNIPVVVADTRDHPPNLEKCRAEFPDIKIFLGKFSEKLLENITTVVLSPGISIHDPFVQSAIQKNIPVIGDIELFARAARAPIIAITGSNGKTTLTTLMGECIRNAGLRAIVCGNIGLPVLDVLQEPVPDYYVVELSSFQLQTTFSLSAKIAVVINLSPDHLDHHFDEAEYLAAKQRVYLNCENAVVNADEPFIWEKLFFKKDPVMFSMERAGSWRVRQHASASERYIDVFTMEHAGSAHTHASASEDVSIGSAGMLAYSPTACAKNNAWSITKDNQALFLSRDSEKIISVSELKLQEQHNLQNFLAALAMCDILQLPIESVKNTLRTFSGLPHRCTLIKTQNNIRWYNDSKATNVGAAIAALESVGQLKSGRLILIAGGDSKGVDLSPLKIPVKKYVDTLIVLGKDAVMLKNTLQADCKTLVHVQTIQEAVQKAHAVAESGDIVLLSPACSSYDQYTGFAARGDDFIQAVEAVYG